MRSVPAGSFQRLIRLESLWAAWLDCRRGKRRQPRMAHFELDVDQRILDLHRVLSRGDFKPSPYRLHIERDPKIRLVAAPAIVDRIVQNALLTDIAPTFERGFIDHSYACCSGRGVHRAVLHYLANIRRYRYRLSLDIRRYFASIDHRILKTLFAHRLRDEETLRLISGFLKAGGEVYRRPIADKALGLGNDPIPANCGMPLGGYLSHWSGGLYLDGLDHFVKRSLKIKAYQRYMDDFTLFHDDWRVLEKVHSDIMNWLSEQRHLELNSRYHRVQPTAQPSTYLGFRVSRAGLAMGPKAKRRLKQRLRNAHALNPEALTRSLQALRGLALTLG